MSKVKKTAKKNVLGVVARTAKKSAVIGANSASIFGYHQPKEPKALKKIKK